MTLQQTDKKKKIISVLQYAAVILYGCIFLLVSSSWSSPLFKETYGYDSAWYSTVGRCILAGYVPYRDLFDLKGPSFFFYQAFGQLIFKSRAGVFFLQCISGGVSALLMFKIARLKLSNLLSWITLVIFYYPYVYLLWGGNTVEELFMPLNLAAIWLGLRYLNERDTAPKDVGNADNDGIADTAGAKEPTDPYICSFFFGCFAGIFAFSKITAGAPLYAVILAVMIFFVRKREFKTLLGCAGFFIMGLILAALPICAFFYFRGAFADMWHCVFSLGLKRSTDYYISFSGEWEGRLLICPVSMVLALLLPVDKEDRVLSNIRYVITVSAPVIYILLHLGSAYIYYFITLIPLWGLDIVLVFGALPGVTALIKERKLVKPVVCAVVTFLILIYFFIPVKNKFIENYELLVHHTDKPYVDACRETISLVPEWERDRVYNIESGFIFYEVNAMLPNNKYSVNLPYFLHLDVNARKEFMELLMKNSPDWIVSEGLAGMDIPEFQTYMDKYYEIVAENDYGYLFRRK